VTRLRSSGPLSGKEIERIERAIPAGAEAGERYPESQMSMRDSEK
jgi:hypothetical protein